MHSKIKSYVKGLGAAVVLCASVWSCTKDIDHTVPATDRDGSALVKLSIHTPSTSVPAASRNAAEGESSVSRIKIMVLEQVSGAYQLGYMVDGQHIVQSSEDTQTTTFNALLLSSETPLKLLLIANYNDAFSGSSFPEGMAEADIRAKLEDTFDSDGINGNLPMYGEISLAKLNAEQPNSFSATMLRAAARVDVHNVINTQVSEKFRMTSTHIYRANDRIALIPDASVMKDGPALSVNAATVPSTAAEYGSFNKIYTEAKDSITQMYLPESLPVTNESLQTSTATCVVVGGYFADDTNPSYYRIDFDSGIEGHPFGQVLRNHKYIFNILEVNERGWPTPGDAANNEATAISVTMQVWDEMTSEMHFGCKDNYLGISSRHIVLDYHKGAMELVYLQTTVDFWIQMLDENGNEVGSPISSVGDSAQGDFYKLKIQRDIKDGIDVYRLLISSLDENKTDNYFSGNFRVYTSQWTFDVTVEQVPFVSVAATRFLNVLTITDLYGDLGTTDGMFTQRSGSAMRRVLENQDNFSPGGTVPVAGILVFDLLNETISSSSAQSLYILEKLLEIIDVVHLPYNCTPSVEASTMLYNWTSSNKNKVLIMGLDNDNTNAHFRQYFTADGYWYESENKATIIGTAYEEEGNQPFLDGPFGKVDGQTDLLYVKSDWGYNNGYNWLTTTPILMVNDPNRLYGMMTMGINREDGVFYMGESRMFGSDGTAMSPEAESSGIVKNNLDKVMANMWAWIIERVIIDAEVEI